MSSLNEKIIAVIEATINKDRMKGSENAQIVFDLSLVDNVLYVQDVLHKISEQYRKNGYGVVYVPNSKGMIFNGYQITKDLNLKRINKYEDWKMTSNMTTIYIVF